jgi:hypothetical protein
MHAVELVDRPKAFLFHTVLPDARNKRRDQGKKHDCGNQDSHPSTSVHLALL